VTRGLIVAAPSSGSGKTTVTLGLLRHLKRAGVRAASAKAGPDYIDPAFHAAASGRDCLNLDPWAMRNGTIAACLADLARDSETILCEGVMGLFDGAGPDNAGSTADLAALLGWPVVLVVDISRQSGSAAALVGGFANHRSDVAVAGVILNRAASARHAEAADAAIATALPNIKRLGWLKRDAGLALPERHLGLVQAGEHSDLERFLDAAAASVAANIDIEALLDLARPAALQALAGETAPLPRLGSRIAVARDEAFAFAYPRMLADWRRSGATLSFFSPLADEAPDAQADAVYLPGGYPELHAGRLASATTFHAGTKAVAARGATVYGECGGYMVLGRGLVDRDGKRHAMLGLLPLESSFVQPKLHLGYRRAALSGESPLGKKGQTWRGHEFHYASVVDEGAGQPLFSFSDAGGSALGSAGRVARHGAGLAMGSFAHLIDRE